MLALHSTANLANHGSTVPQLREDVTRFRYGDEQHLDEALTRIFQFGRQKGIPRRSVALRKTLTVSMLSNIALHY